VKVGFGIDLAGYTTGHTALAAVTVGDAHADVVLLRKSPMSGRRRTAELLADAVAVDLAALKKCLALGPVAVDIPIDLQGLPCPSHAKAIWELTLRPVDKTQRAMAPFADRIGSPVARFCAVMRTGELYPEVGRTIFETYPAATWRQLRLESGNYKSKEGAAARAVLCRSMNIASDLDTDHDIDAVVCALTAVADDAFLCSPDMLCEPADALPRGYRILKSWPFESIDVTIEYFESWLAANGRVQ
jgi:hypothetical protein